MKRKATRFLALAMSAVLVTSLTACGDGSDENAKDAVTPVEAQPMLSELELEILNLETKYNKGEFTQEDYLSLADAYNRAGYIRKQRDMLEQDYRLYADEEAFAALQELSVNLEEETEGIRSRAQEMQNDLELTEYLGESVEGKTVFIADDIIASGESMLEVASNLKERGAANIIANATFPLFTSGLEKFDKAVAEGKLTYVVGTNLTYRMPELLTRDWYVDVDVFQVRCILCGGSEPRHVCFQHHRSAEEDRESAGKPQVSLIRKKALHPCDAEPFSYHKSNKTIIIRLHGCADTEPAWAARRAA